MSADFWAGYVSGAVGIVVGNPLDLIKTRIQAATTTTTPATVTTGLRKRSAEGKPSSLTTRGSAAPILGYGALNALLFVTYNRVWDALGNTPANAWVAGAAGGLATFVVSAPTEIVKCQVQVLDQTTSFQVARAIWRKRGLAGFYQGGAVTSVRDSVGYGFYFWAYERCKHVLQASDQEQGGLSPWKTLLAGGIAGVATWASIFPLDVIKTRMQTQDLLIAEQSLPCATPSSKSSLERPRLSATRIAMQAYRDEGFTVFIRGIGICSARAFIVNAVQWTVYEATLKFFLSRLHPSNVSF